MERTSRSFDGERVLGDVSTALNKGELVSLLGINGGGKAILFNIITGLSRPDTGHVLLGGGGVIGCSGRVSCMLQKGLLLPYQTIEDNMALPPTIKGMEKREARELASPCFHQSGLEGAQKKCSSQLSGGMRQRAALLRAYLFPGSVVLLDEPFSALDTMTKKSVHDRYLEVMDEIHLSTLFITHDTNGAILLFDRTYLLANRPGRMTEELITEETKPRDRDFSLMVEFLEYKRYIPKHLERTVQRSHDSDSLFYFRHYDPDTMIPV